MKTKALSLTLASLLSIQNVAIANTDRTEGVGEQAVSEAKATLQSLRTELSVLDKSLADAANTIREKGDKGRSTSVIAVTGAGIGLGLSAMALMTAQKRSEAAPLGVLFYGITSVSVTIVASVIGLTNETIRPDIDTKTAEAQLQEAQKNISSLMSEAQDSSTSEALEKIQSSLKMTQESLAQYQAKRSGSSRNNLISHATQLAGAAMVSYGLTQRDSRLVLVGPMLMNAGNLGALISSMSQAQSQSVLAEITKTRQALKASEESLK